MTTETATGVTTELTRGTWNADVAHSQVEFTIRHLGLARVRGRFNDFTATAVVADDLTLSSVEATVEMSSIDTNNADRDAHIKSTDFFDIENQPQMTFRSTSIEGSGSDYRLVGDLTINGVTKQTEFALEFLGVVVDGYDATRAGFVASTEINRKDFGVEFNMPIPGGGMLLSDSVKIDLDIQLVRG